MTDNISLVYKCVKNGRNRTTALVAVTGLDRDTVTASLIWLRREGLVRHNQTHGWRIKD